MQFNTTCNDYDSISQQSHQSTRTTGPQGGRGANHDHAQGGEGEERRWSFFSLPHISDIISRLETADFCRVASPSGEYAPNWSANDTVGDTTEVCCSSISGRLNKKLPCQGTCALHSCSTGVRVPAAQDVVASNDMMCCEDGWAPRLLQQLAD